MTKMLFLKGRKSLSVYSSVKYVVGGVHPPADIMVQITYIIYYREYILERSRFKM